jgi:hypothetical protein
VRRAVLGSRGPLRHVDEAVAGVGRHRPVQPQRHKPGLGLEVAAGLGDSPAGAEQTEPRRGYRRIAWIERALQPLRPQLDSARFEQLVSVLAMVVGWEALIVLQDLRGLAPAEQAETSAWAAQALVRAALHDQNDRPATRE